MLDKLFGLTFGLGVLALAAMPMLGSALRKNLTGIGRKHEKPK